MKAKNRHFSRLMFVFTSVIWQHKGQGGWYFVTLPEDLSQEIRNYVKSEENGWGRLRATAKIVKREWETSIWFDTKCRCYLLPLKAEIRKSENLHVDNIVHTTLWI
jgi:hypothetical protein